MTESWTINTLIISSIILMVVPVLIYVYKEVIVNKMGDSNDV